MTQISPERFGRHGLREHRLHALVTDVGSADAGAGDDGRVGSPATAVDDARIRRQRLAVSSLVLAFTVSAAAVSYAIGALPF